MTSSSELPAIQRQVVTHPHADSTHVISDFGSDEDGDEDNDDDDENGTALGFARTVDPVFTPQPNAFSHPPSSASQPQRAVPGSYFPASQSQARPLQPRSAYPNRPRTSYSTNPHADHDAALRASLTTLLSCAAAARGLSKPTQSYGHETALAGATERPGGMAMRLVPESALMASSPDVPSPRPRSTPSTSSRDGDCIEKKRTATADRENARMSVGSAKKKQRLGSAKTAVQQEALISPTLLTWVVGAGVVVLVGVVGFGAGYALGREVGRGEGVAGMSGTSAGGSCGREIVKSGGAGGLKRLRWGAGVGSGRGVSA